MTDQHRATEHNKNNVAMMPSEGTIQGMLADCIQEIFSRIESLEAAALERGYAGSAAFDSAAAALRAAADREKLGPDHWEGSRPDDYERGWNAALRNISRIATELDVNQ
jgi:hypothetical protein